jgi:very-short-patch-repair endonuclease
VVLLDRFIVDFYAPSVRLVVEVDGEYHERRARADARRDEKLARAGYTVVRLSADVVVRAMPEALARIGGALGAGISSSD